MKDRPLGIGRGATLRGRGNECMLLDALLSAIQRGEGRSLVLRGEAGIGKTALLEYLLESALDTTVVRASGVESEMELAFGTLHQLSAPLLDRREGLPDPQCQALEIVFGERAGTPPDRFLVGLATLGLFSAAAEERPLLCVVDDAQWVDHESALALAFVARRLLAEPVAIVFAAREPGDELDHLPELEVQGLRDGDARALLASEAPSLVDEPVRDRIIAEMRGNPLALLELPRGLTATELAGGFGMPGADGLSGRIEESYIRRLEALPEDARRLLLVAAAEPVGDPLLLQRASERLGIEGSAVDATDQFLALGERVTFRHPLVRSAAYRSAGVTERRAAHLALAEATDRGADPDRHAWHLAAAASGPDEAVALELEQSAGRAQARGGVAAAAAFLQRAVALTQNPGRRAIRALAAAEVAFQAGMSDAALRLVAIAEAAPLDEVQRARVDLLRGQVAFASGLASDAPSLLLNAAKRLEGFDPELARQTYLTAWGAATVAPGHLAGGGVLLEISRAILDLPRRPGAPRPLDLLLAGLALLTTEGRDAATPTLQRAAEVLPDLPVEDVLRWGWMATSASNAVWDNDGAYAISARQAQLVRDAGALAQLPLHLSALGMARAWTGDLAGAASIMAEADGVAAAIGSVRLPWAALRLRALQGREAEAAAAIANAIEQAAAGAHSLAIYAHWAAAVLYNGLARYEEAAASARQANSNTFEYWVSVWVLPELVEATARVQDTASARDALERLAETTQPSANDFALGIEARCRALLSNGAIAERLYQDAIERLGRTRLRPELGRAHLLYGEWLRRENRRVDARVHLHQAHDLFTAIGMEAFAERARVELRATGETVRKRTAETRDDLTPQEQQIAGLARDGLSNPEIGARLFLSPRTVEWHLRKVFAKLGIHSRRELVTALPDSEPELVPS
jgi:DNA-binding CsgD family transcriptional regulator